MHYLKCNHCGHLNKVKTEYMTICQNCGKKLDNAFPAWNKIHTEKNFEDFKSIVCVTEEELNQQNNLEGGKKKKGAKFWFGFIIAAVVGALSMQYAPTLVNLYFKDNIYDQVMMKAASEINKSCPMMIDSETQLDNAIALPDNVFQYNYTLINLDTSEADIEALKDYLEPEVINFVKTNPNMKIQREHKSTINYAYKDKNRKHLFTISVSPEKYLEE